MPGARHSLRSGACELALKQPRIMGHNPVSVLFAQVDSDGKFFASFHGLSMIFKKPKFGFFRHGSVVTLRVVRQMMLPAAADYRFAPLEHLRHIPLLSAFPLSQRLSKYAS